MAEFQPQRDTTLSPKVQGSPWVVLSGVKTLLSFLSADGGTLHLGLYKACKVVPVSSFRRGERKNNEVTIDRPTSKSTELSVYMLANE